MTQAIHAPPLSRTVLSLIDLGGIGTRAEIEMQVRMDGGQVVPLADVEGLHQLPKPKDHLAAQWILTSDVLSCAETRVLLDKAFLKREDRLSRDRALSAAMTHIRDFRVPHGFMIPCPRCWGELLDRRRAARTGPFAGNYEPKEG